MTDLLSDVALLSLTFRMYPTIGSLPGEVRNLHPLRELLDESTWQAALTDAARLNSMGFYTFPELVGNNDGPT